MVEAAPEDWIQVGQVVGAYGVRGWLRIHPYTAQPDAALEYRPWRFRGATGRVWAPTVVEARCHGKGLVTRIAECETREGAEALAGAALEVPAAALPRLPPGEYYWGELVGLAVASREGVPLGTVAKLMETGANDVLVVRDAGRERLIPYIKSVIQQVDRGAGRIIVDWDPDF